jgi:hypothetical protein
MGDLKTTIQRVTQAFEHNKAIYYSSKNAGDKAIYAATANEFAKQRKRFVTLYERDVVSKSQLKLQL